MIFKEFTVISSLLLCLALGGATVSASEHEVGHGGNDVGLDFEQSFLNALNNLKSTSPDVANKLPLDVWKILDRAKVYSVDEELTVEVGGTKQSCVAINDQKSIIKVNFLRWEEIFNSHIKEGIALHEFLSLEGIEDTGQYPISAQYLAQFDIPATALTSGKDGDDHYISAAVTLSSNTSTDLNKTRAVYFGVGSSPDEATRNAYHLCQIDFTNLGVCKLPNQSSNFFPIVSNSTRGCITVYTNRATSFVVGVGPSISSSRASARAQLQAYLRSKGPGLPFTERSECAQ